MSIVSNKMIPVAFLLIIFAATGCSTTDKSTTTEEPTDTAPDTAASETEEMAELNLLLSSNRSTLSDLHLTQQHDMPPAFLKKKTDNESINNNPEDGYRVQILSTTNIDLADSVAIAFRTWADSTIKGYTAESYTSFNQPYYRVHVGDFQDRSKANSFSKLVKNRFPDAWVVHDQIEPESVPADTASFSIKTEEDRMEEERLQESKKDSLDHSSGG